MKFLMNIITLQLKNSASKVLWKLLVLDNDIVIQCVSPIVSKSSDFMIQNNEDVGAMSSPQQKCADGGTRMDGEDPVCTFRPAGPSPCT